MCGRRVPEATSSSFVQPWLGADGPPTVEVMTRPCQAGTTATRASPSPSTTTSTWRRRKATSSSKVRSAAERGKAAARSAASEAASGRVGISSLLDDTRLRRDTRILAPEEDASLTAPRRAD